MKDIEEAVINANKEQTAQTTTAELSRQDISNSKPRVKKAGYHTMKAPFATGTHGSKVVPFGAIEYLAGAKISNLQSDFIIKMQPLSHVTFDNLKLQMFAVYVPNTRVWNSFDADAFSSQKEDRYQSKIVSPPMITPGNPQVVNLSGTNTVTYTTTLWRDSIAYHYFGKEGLSSAPFGFNALYTRGYRAIWNDIFRDKIMNPALPEWNESIVTAAERNSTFHYGLVPETNPVIDRPSSSWSLQNCPSYKSYWNNWRHSVYSNNNAVDNTSLFTHVVSQQQIDEFRSQSENINKTDAEIIAEIRGTYIARQNQCYIIGQKTIDIDISLQPMTGDTSALQLGADGALSYTYGSADIISDTFSAPKDGIIHYLYYICAADSSVWQNGINVEHTKSNWSDFYRPSLGIIKDAPIYSREINGNNDNSIVGYKRRYSEYFRHPVYIRGDFPQFTSSFSSTNSRTNTRGFATNNTNDTVRISLPSTSDWNLLSTREEVGSPIWNRYDHVVHSLRRILLFNGGTLTTDEFVRRSSQTFYLYGSVSLTIDQPIAESIKNEIIPYGAE
jgi:hypothetical protein